MTEKRKTEIERRNFAVTELRAITDEKGLRHITGYAAVFNTLSEDLGRFREKIDPGAFSETIKTDDVRALWNHDSNYPLGRNRANTLTLNEDTHGLKIDIVPPDTQWARDLMTSIDRGDVDQMSFGFQTLSDRWETVDKVEIRTLIKVRLYDVSPVTFPAYPDTEVGLRSLEEYRKTAGPSTGDAARTADPSTGLGLLKEEDETYRKIKGIKEEDHE
jgi:hypothetical protein